ncbi:hypothetical protein [Kineosporia sp. NBRC 101731]|uniref:hypothetical protein n=1 Tax=Kineosporia sp. NBRC 101731 TaxID=3032199 RepID=UPI00255446CA|nr:hypothetical protein [Kineosporia sp. NBRC 101731]
MSSTDTSTPVAPEASPQGPPTATTVLVHDIADESPLRDPVRRRLLLVLGAAVIVLALAVGLVRMIGMIGDGSQAERDAAGLEQVRAQIRRPLQELLVRREAFFAAEREYLTAMKQAQDDVAGGARPTQQIATLRRVAREMRALDASLREVNSVAEATSEARAYLVDAVRILARDAARNATTLQMGDSPLVAVNDENALVPVRRMNTSLLFVLDAAQLPVTGLDLPGGTDPHPEDHSTAR